MKTRAWYDLPVGSQVQHGACILGPDQKGPAPTGLSCWVGQDGTGLLPHRWHGWGSIAESDCMAPCAQLPLPCWPKAWEQWLPFWGSQGFWPEHALLCTVNPSARPGPAFNLEKALGYRCCSWRTTGPLSKQGGECAPSLGLFVLALPGGGLAQLGC